MNGALADPIRHADLSETPYMHRWTTLREETVEYFMDRTTLD